MNTITINNRLACGIIFHKSLTKINDETKRAERFEWFVRTTSINKLQRHEEEIISYLNTTGKYFPKIGRLIINKHD